MCGKRTASRARQPRRRVRDGGSWAEGETNEGIGWRGVERIRRKGSGSAHLTLSGRMGSDIVGPNLFRLSV